MAHSQPIRELHGGPDPRSRYYHVGHVCDPEYNWHPAPKRKANVEDKTSAFEHQLSFALEMHSRLYPQAEPLDMKLLGVENFTYNDVHSEGSLEKPGVGWVCFDCSDEEPEGFELVYACTRMFKVPNRGVTPQYLALVVVNTSGISKNGENEYRRIGIAQVHAKNWFWNGRREVFNLV
jgi:hypothetical protein